MPVSKHLLHRRWFTSSGVARENVEASHFFPSGVVPSSDLRGLGML